MKEAKMAEYFTDKRFLEIEDMLDSGYMVWKDEGKAREAEEQLLAGWERIPELDIPELQHEYHYLRQTRSRMIVEFYRDSRQFAKALAWVDIVRKIYGPGWDPSVEFLAATVHHSSGDIQKAFEIFDRLYKEYKKQPFLEKDKKYLEFYLEQKSRNKLKTRQ
jgi:tetratricopeptide (TPR) repeat protein